MWVLLKSRKASNFVKKWKWVEQKKWKIVKLQLCVIMKKKPKKKRDFLNNYSNCTNY